MLRVLLCCLLAPADALSAVARAPCAVRSAPPRPLLAQPPLQRVAEPLMKTASPDIADRAIACGVYLLPFLDGFPYGIYVYKTVPGLRDVAFSLVPLVNAFQSVPFGGLIFFFALSYFASNTQLSRFVRFNIQQAILLDIVLIAPGLLSGFSRNLPPEINAMGSNFVFYIMALTVGYAIFSNVQGKTPDQVPILSNAAAMQIP